jgi:hypothetical protein
MDVTDEGYIKLYRKTLVSFVSKDALTLGIWSLLLLYANWKPQRLRNGVVLGPGQLFISQAQFCKDHSISRGSLRTRLRWFSAWGCAHIKSTKAGTYITICNWSTYQDSETTGQQPDNQRLVKMCPTVGQNVPTEEEEEERTKKYIPSIDVDVIIDGYRRWHPRARPGRKERAMIKARLDEGWDTESLLRALEGLHASKWHAGDNPDRKKYLGLSVALRTSERVQHFLESMDNESEQTSEAKRASRAKEWQEMLKRQAGRNGKA